MEEWCTHKHPQLLKSPNSEIDQRWTETSKFDFTFFFSHHLLRPHTTVGFLIALQNRDDEIPDDKIVKRARFVLEPELRISCQTAVIGAYLTTVHNSLRFWEIAMIISRISLVGLVSPYKGIFLHLNGDN